MNFKAGRILLGMMIGLITAYGIAVFSSQPGASHPYFFKDGVLVITQRGGRNLWPENMLFAFQKAVE